MTEINSSETNDLLNAHRSDAESGSQAGILAQEEVDEQTRTYIAPLTRQLEDLTQLIQRMWSVHGPNLPQGRLPVLILAQRVRRPTLTTWYDQSERLLKTVGYTVAIQKSIVL